MATIPIAVPLQQTSTLLNGPLAVQAEDSHVWLPANGDWLEIRGGTYAENITTSTQPIASGTNWDNATVIKGYANETVTLAPTNGGSAIAMEKAQYVIFANLVIDGSQNPNTGNAGDLVWNDKSAGLSAVAPSPLSKH